MPSTYSKEQCETIGKLEIFSNRPLGRGTNGNTCRGRYEEFKSVAVKSVTKIKNNEDVIKQLQSICEVLGKVGGSNKIVGYVTTEVRGQIIYLATDRWGIDATKVLKKIAKFSRHKIIKVIKRLCKAFSFLHSNGIVHGNIHPGNVLFNEKLVLKITDFGVSHLLPGTHITWMSPEQGAVNGKSTYKATTADDIFSLAILIYYIYTNGKHLFGDRSSQEENIRNNNPKFTRCINRELKHLILGMINKNPQERLNIAEVIKHPFFWSNEFRLDFIRDVVKHIKLQEFERCKKCIDDRSKLVSIRRWHKKLGRTWTHFLKKEKKRYKCDSTLSGLLFFIRNKFYHNEWEREIKLFELLKNRRHPKRAVDAKSYMRFFMQTFPKLILVLATTECVKCLPLNTKFVLPWRPYS